jgi:hypothetical protein
MWSMVMNLTDYVFEFRASLIVKQNNKLVVMNENFKYLIFNN